MDKNVKPSGLPDSSRWARSPGVVARTIRGEALLIPIHRTADALGGFYALNPSASHIWQCASEGRSLGEISGALAQFYEVSPETARADTERVVAELVELGALIPSERPA